MPAITKLSHATPWVEVVSTAKDWQALGPDRLVRMHYHLNLIRAFEEAVLEASRQGLVNGPAHTSLGQEAGAVGSIACLDTPDLITGAHRGHHQFIAKGLRLLDHADHDPRRAAVPSAVQEFLHRALAEILGLTQGYCRGRGGSMHLRWDEAGMLGTNAIVGGGVPMAAGAAWAHKRAGTGDVAFTYFGDGAVNIGSVLETMNLAAAWKLPLCFFIENNRYAVSTHVEEADGGAPPVFARRRLRHSGLAGRRHGPGAVHLASKQAIARMRAGEGPAIIEAMVYRYFHHGGRSPAAPSAIAPRTRRRMARRDPIERVASELTDRGS